MFDKIKVIGIAALFTVVIAVIGAILEFSSTVDWSGFGVFGPAIGLAIGTGGAWLLGYMKKEFSGYGTSENPSITPLKAPDGD